MYFYPYYSLLDIKVKEQTIENLMKGNKIFEPPRYMRTHEAAKQLLDIIERVSIEHVYNHMEWAWHSLLRLKEMSGLLISYILS